MKNSTHKFIKAVKIILKIFKIILIIAAPIYITSHLFQLASKKDNVSTLPVIYCTQTPVTTQGSNGETFTIENVIGQTIIEGSGISNGIIILNLMIMTISFALVFQLLRIAQSFISSIEKNKIFTSENIKHLQNIGFILITIFLLDTTLILTNSIITKTMVDVKISYLLGYFTGESVETFITIAFVFIIAGVFRVGYNLREENQSFV